MLFFKTQQDLRPPDRGVLPALERTSGSADAFPPAEYEPAYALTPPHASLRDGPHRRDGLAGLAAGLLFVAAGSRRICEYVQNKGCFLIFPGLYFSYYVSGVIVSIPKE